MDTNNNINNTSLRKEFIQKKEDQSDKVLEEAQRLVNLYRHSQSFPPEFHEELDKQLAQTSFEVQAALPRIVGGDEIRNYIDFLKMNISETSKASDETNEDTTQSSFNGYLPDPTDDIPLSSEKLPSFSDSGMAAETSQNLRKLVEELTSAKQSELEKLIQIQTETLSKLLRQLDQNRQELAGHQTDRLINALNQKEVEKKKYSDIIEAETPVFIPDETEGF